MKKTFKLYLINHSHTDLGYTDLQTKIKRNHYDYIRQAMAIMDLHEDFFWTLENFWLVENFLEYASKKEKRKLIYYFKKGQMILTGNYLNMTDLLHGDIYQEKLALYEQFKKHYKIKSTSALTSDVNGFKRSYMKALLNHGVNHLMMSVHPHHGVAPTFKNQNPFYIKIDGEKLLIWNNEHYLLGNDLGIVPHTLASYTIKDEFKEPLGTYGLEEEINISEIRIKRYVERFRRDEDYPYDFVPVLLSGQRIDNAAPNVAILSRIKALNQLLSTEEIQIEFKALDDIFDEIKKNEIIPVYTGLFPDFWVDGVVSTPKVTKLFRNTQRQLSLFKRYRNKAYKEEIKQIETKLTLYAEHTWGHSESVRNPYDEEVYQLLAIKESLVFEAYSMLSELILKCQFNYLNRSYMKPNRDLIFTVYNPHEVMVKELVTLKLDYFELKPFEEGLKIIDNHGQDVLADVDMKNPLKKQIKAWVEVSPKSKKELILKPRLFQSISNIKFSEGQFENDWVKINFKDMSIFSKKRNELLTTGDYFGFIHQISKCTKDYATYREELKLNRMSEDVKNGYCQLISSHVKSDTLVSSEIELIYQLETIDELKVTYKIFKRVERIDIQVNFLKKATYDVENIYFQFPFKYEQLFLMNENEEFKPWIDQIPGSLIDFYHTDYGIRFENKAYDVVILSKDNPLYFLGDIEGLELELMNDSLDLSKRIARSWIMNNYWETNFNLDLSGFFNFNYTILVDNHKKDLRTYRALSEGLFVVRS